MYTFPVILVGDMRRLTCVCPLKSSGGLAQLGERMAGSHEVIGSNPLSSMLTSEASLVRYLKFLGD